MILKYIPSYTAKGAVIGGTVGLVGGAVSGAWVCTGLAIQKIAIQAIMQGSQNIQSEWVSCLKMTPINSTIGLAVIGACLGFVIDFIQFVDACDKTLMRC